MLLCEHKLKQRENIINDLERYASYLRGKGYFDRSDGAQNSLVFPVGEKYFKHNSGSNSSRIEIWISKGLTSQSLELFGTVGTANDIKMSKPIRPAYVIFNHKESFFQQKKRKCHKKLINSKYLYSIQPISKNYKFR